MLYGILFDTTVSTGYRMDGSVRFFTVTPEITVLVTLTKCNINLKRRHQNG